MLQLESRTDTCVTSLFQVKVAAEELKTDNELLLSFSPAENVAKGLEKEHGKVSVSHRYVNWLTWP